MLIFFVILEILVFLKSFEEFYYYYLGRMYENIDMIIELNVCDFVFVNGNIDEFYSIDMVFNLNSCFLFRGEEYLDFLFCY